MALKNLKKDPSLTDKAYSAIKSAIMSNELTPGTVLAEENLASQLGISRTPLRAALQRLQHEEIVMQNGKNMVVAEVTERDVRDISVVRIQLEPLAIRLLAQNGGITAKHLAFEADADAEPLQPRQPFRRRLLLRHAGRCR